MKLTFLSMLLLGITFGVAAQVKTEAELMQKYNSNQSDKDIDEYASNYKNLSAESIYYVAELYTDRDNFIKALKYVNLSLEKDTNNARAFSLKADVLYSLQKYDDAIKIYQIAIRKRPYRSMNYSGLGDCYYALKNNNQALTAYIKATEQEDHYDHPYYMSGIIYLEQNENDKALDAFYKAKSISALGSETYSNIMYNISLLELKPGNIIQAESALVELIQYDSTYYKAYPKLIQLYKSINQNNKAIPYKNKLKEAIQNNLITEEELKKSVIDILKE